VAPEVGRPAHAPLVGFIGGGLIFVRSDIVRGLTTAAIVWMTAAVGMACGAGLWLLAIAVTAGHFVVVLVYTELTPRLPPAAGTDAGVRVVYEDGRGILRTVLAECTRRAFAVASIQTQRLEPAAVAVTLELLGRGSVDDLTVALSELDGVRQVTLGD
jgi:putative Mg2+ transporter-C (MgtC) family protein